MVYQVKFTIDSTENGASLFTHPLKFADEREARKAALEVLEVLNRSIDVISADYMIMALGF